ncbi:hypothetical protein NDU88_005002 [Pleurodeles waltl]|uniref:Uncharacterized protein n=1 Tax=Pleurodeles waltl TaxID=8319 RepID=A0AAV7LSM5_PLEWA|nr:hypothetical protein NDU88_005002 [Pleurodeles waltl]
MRLRTAQHKLYDTVDKAEKLLAWLGMKEMEVRWVDEVVTPEGVKVPSNKQIAEAFPGYYQDLYQTRPLQDAHQNSEYLQNIAIPILDTEARGVLEGDINLEEMKAAMTKLRSGKAPGPKRFPAEFFRRLGDILAPHFLNIFLEARKPRNPPSRFEKGRDSGNT